MQFSWWYLFVSIPVIWSLWIGFRVFRGINKPSDFFWYPEGMSSEKLRDSLTASNISVGSAIFAFLSFGYSYKLAAFISPLTWLLGFFILYKVFPRIENSEKRTLHGFLANRYDSRFIGYFASLLSIIGFLGTYGIEILVGIKIAKVLFPNVSSIYIILGLSLVVCTYTALGGFKAVIDTEKMQLWFSYVGIAAVFGFLISHNENVLSLETLASDHWGFSNLSVLFVLSLIVVNVPWQLIDMSVWQRVCSMRDQKDIKKGLSQSIYSIGISWCVLISLGVLLNYFPDFTAPSNNDYGSLLLSYLQEPWAFALFAAGCFAALVSTADTLLIASIQTFVFDILYPSHSLKTIEDTNDPEKMKGLLRYGRKMVYLFGLISPLFIYLVSIVIPGVLDLFFLVYSAQIILLIPICVAIFREDCVRMRKYAIFSLSAGGVQRFRGDDELGLACAVPAVGRAGGRRPGGARAHGGDPDLPHGAGAQRGGQGPGGGGVPQELGAGAAGHVPGGRDLYAVLHAGHLVAGLGHQAGRSGRRRPRVHQPGVPAHADGGRVRVCAVHRALLRVCRPDRPAPRADVLVGGARCVRGGVPLPADG